MWKGRPQLHLADVLHPGVLPHFRDGRADRRDAGGRSLQLQAHDTHFVVAHLHYVLIGGFVFPLLAAGAYWMPQITQQKKGRARIKGLGEAAFATILIGFHGNVLRDAPDRAAGHARRVDVYTGESRWVWLNPHVVIFGFVMAIGFALFALDLILQTTLGQRARRNIWGRADARLGDAASCARLQFRLAAKPSPRGMPAPPPRSCRWRAARGCCPARPGPARAARHKCRQARGSIIGILPGNTALPLVLSASIGSFVLLMLGPGSTGSRRCRLWSSRPLIWVWQRGSGAAITDRGRSPSRRGGVGGSTAAPPHPGLERVVAFLIADGNVLRVGGCSAWASCMGSHRTGPPLRAQADGPAGGGSGGRGRR